jgi:dolichol kinase
VVPPLRLLGMALLLFQIIICYLSFFGFFVIYLKKRRKVWQSVGDYKERKEREEKKKKKELSTRG